MSSAKQPTKLRLRCELAAARKEIERLTVMYNNANTIACDWKRLYEKAAMTLSIANDFISSAAKHFDDPATTRCKDCTSKLFLYQARAAEALADKEREKS